MGSKATANGDSHADPKPDNLILTWPTTTERTKVWTLTHPQWGPALTEEDYLRREVYLLTVPLAKHGGITQWILTSAGPSAPDARPILSSCETLRKRALVRRPDGHVVEAAAHGIASVFTPPDLRGRGHAGRMMSLLGQQLRGWQGSALRGGQAVGEGTVAFSVLFSDIGKKFYAERGWRAYESTHLKFPPAALEPSGGEKLQAKPVGYHELAELCAADEKLLREQLADSSRWPAGKTVVALVPDLDTILWHQMREDFMTKHIFQRTPTVKGAVYGSPGQRLWAVWTRGYYGGLDKIEGNTLFILRFVIENEDAEEAHLIDGVRAIIAVAQGQAKEWWTQYVEMWNPTSRLKELVEKSGLEHEFVVREKDSITSLMWYGDGPVEDVQWVANEKFGWC